MRTWGGTGCGRKAPDSTAKREKRTQQNNALKRMWLACTPLGLKTFERTLWTAWEHRRKAWCSRYIHRMEKVLRSMVRILMKLGFLRTPHSQIRTNQQTPPTRFGDIVSCNCSRAATPHHIQPRFAPVPFWPLNRRNDIGWRKWFDESEPENCPVPEYEDRICVLTVRKGILLDP